MNYQLIIKSKKQPLLFLLVGLLLLSACPAKEGKQKTSETTPEPEHVEMKQTETKASNLPKLEKGFTQEGIACCWTELVDFAKTQNIDYKETIQEAVKGKDQALADLLNLSGKVGIDLSYGHGAILDEILVRVGDSHFADVLKSLPLQEKHAYFEENLQVTLRNLIEGGFMFHKDLRIQALSLSQFPQTSLVLAYKVQ